MFGNVGFTYIHFISFDFFPQASYNSSLLLHEFRLLCLTLSEGHEGAAEGHIRTEIACHPYSAILDRHALLQDYLLPALYHRPILPVTLL